MTSENKSRVPANSVYASHHQNSEYLLVSGELLGNFSKRGSEIWYKPGLVLGTR